MRAAPTVVIGLTALFAVVASGSFGAGAQAERSEPAVVVHATALEPPVVEAVKEMCLER